LQRYGRFEISISASSFAQPNPSAASQLYEALAKLAPTGRTALDLYAGSGIIAMHLADRFSEVIALDIDGSSIARGKEDSKRLGLGNLRFVKADAKALELPPNLDLITVDPPRAGLNKDIRQIITDSTSPILIYVSCDVATWARDIAEFEKQGWTLQSLETFDFYPHTYHIELLSVLVR
jgi:tRNA/tmRNA/rRNA uracil-C5-methylase (TrmA/RlmC/RlmD family)